MSYQPKGKTSSSVDQRATRALILVAALSIICLAVVLFSPLFWLRNVSIQGAKKIDPDSIAEVAKNTSTRDFAFLRSSSLAVLNESAVENALMKKFPDIAAVSVSKRWPGSLNVQIEERSSVLNWQTGTEYYRIDQEGIAFEKRTEPPEKGDRLVIDLASLPVEVGKPVVGRNFIATINDLNKAFTEKGITVKHFEVVDTTFEVRVITDRGFYVLVDATRSAENQAEAAVSVLKSAKPAAYIDVRVPGRAYVR